MKDKKSPVNKRKIKQVSKGVRKHVRRMKQASRKETL